MRRFEFNDDEDNFEEEPFSEEAEAILTPEEYKALLEEDQAWQAWQMAMVQRELNSRLLWRVIKTLEKSFFWRFYSVETKLTMTEAMYKRLHTLEEGFEE